MRKWIGYGRLALCGLITLSTIVLWRTGDLLLRLAAPQSRPGWRNRCLQGWAHAMLGALRGRVVREGAPPSQPGLFVCNHLSYVDLLICLSEWPCVFVSKIEVTRIPVIGAVAADIGTIFINRQDFTDVARVNTRIDQAIAQGMSVVIFPEATTTEGSGLLPFHASLLESAARSGRPVWYGALHYSAPVGSRPASESVAWGEDIGMREHLQRLLALPSFTARMRYGREPIGGTNRKQLAQALRSAVYELFEPVGQ